MRRWFTSLGYRMNMFMRGRYGYDELFLFLSIAGVLLMFLSYIPYLRFLYLLGAALLVWAWFRSMSRNIFKRQMERGKYLSIKNKIVQKFRLYKNKWRDRKVYKYYKCPNCKVTVRISNPGKGRKITINCPKCRQSFDKKT